MSRSAQYLVAVYELEETEGAPIATGRLARAVDRSPSATTEMVQRLESEGLVEHEPYVGVSLTDAGRERARELHETHQTLCRFFRDVLDLDAYEREALELAGVVSPTVARRLKRTVVPADGPPSDG